MQKTLFLIFMTIWGYSVRAQQTLLSEGVGIDVPNNAKRLNKEQAIAHATKKFSKNKFVIDAISTRNAEHIYEVDDVLVSLLTDNKGTKEGHLTELKNGLDESFGQSKIQGYKSSLKKINNNTVLTISYTINGVETYTFFVFNAHNSRSVTGTLEFSNVDESKAADILDKLLNSIKFKD